MKDKNDENNKINRFLTIIEPYINKGSQLHEQVGIMVTKKLILSAIKDYTSNPCIPDEEYINQLFEILVKEIVIKILTEENSFFN